MHRDAERAREDQRPAAAERVRQPPAAPGLQQVLALQRSAGNAAVTRALLRQPTQQQEREAMPRTDLGIRVTTGTTDELRAEKERLRAIVDHEYDTLTEREAAELSRSLQRLEVLLGERGNSTLADADVELVFDGTNISFTGSRSDSWPAVSGRPVNGAFDYSPERQRMENVGPIPAGTYWLDPRQLQDLRARALVYDIFGNFSAAWGSHRITIHPFDTTHTFGRGGFFIHGGSSPGSAGCIDLTSRIGEFAELLSSVPPERKVKLHVRYPAAAPAAAAPAGGG